MEKIVNRELLFSSESRVSMRGQVYNVPRGLVWDMLWVSQRERERRNGAEEGERELGHEGERERVCRGGCRSV